MWYKVAIGQKASEYTWKAQKKEHFVICSFCCLCVCWLSCFFYFVLQFFSLVFSSFLKPAEVEGGPPPPDCCAIKDTWKNEFDLIQFKHFAIQFNIIAVPLEISVTKVNFVSWNLYIWHLRTWQSTMINILFLQIFSLQLAHLVYFGNKSMSNLSQCHCLTKAWQGQAREFHFHNLSEEEEEEGKVFPDITVCWRKPENLREREKCRYGDLWQSEH